MKQKICLTEEQLLFLEEFLGKRKTVCSDEAKILQAKFNLSWNALARRANVSKRKLIAGYSWAEFIKSTCAGLIKKRYIWFNCKSCSILVEMQLAKFLARRVQCQLCKHHYFETCVFTEEWKQKNSKSQIISQNKPETIEKHRTNSRKMWTDENRRLSMTENIKKRWEDVNFREKVIGKGKFSKHGIYKDITYASLAELSFILWMNDNGRKIKRYSGTGISYFLHENESHKYYPDYVLDDVSLVEVKSKYWFEKHRELVEIKSEACRQFCHLNGKEFKFVLMSDIPVEFYKKAKIIHETQKQSI